MDPSIQAVQELLDQTARQCLRYILEHDLSAAQSGKLAKFVFGCMNQKHELPSRVEKRGSGELDKVLRFIAKAAEVLLEIDREHDDKLNE
jgi:hypothetical protein